ncbi:rab-GTPase-TBC domain-containing protein [Epithele typhae]|uniref:rab-GTPase-TBC domain-containing protein n=1 Tax=Epithele typhae TaxID=378194 RepID=UPI002007F016|nr:rab-GTPase-TBC domain-containing protein [Epithele typhae]KAH9916946.1 rab-GTPase-TBC domain-containing protein [Epithele typhae]
MNDDIPPASQSHPIDALEWQVYRTLSLQPHGFGEERVRIWPKLVHLNDHYYEDRRELSLSSAWSEVSMDIPEIEGELDGTPHTDEHQIELDTDRSFVLYPVDQSNDRERRQNALNRLIVSIFRKRPRLHYFQGYHDIVSVVFLTLPKEMHLPVVEKLSLHRVRDSMGPNLDPVVGLLRILKNLLRLADSQFAATLERTAPLPYYALSNLLTLFSHDVPTLPLIQHIFDYLLSRPPIAVVYLAAALILTRREEVQLLEDEGEEGMMHSLLTVLPDLYEEGEEAPELPNQDPVPPKHSPEAPSIHAVEGEEAKAPYGRICGSLGRTDDLPPSSQPIDVLATSDESSGATQTTTPELAEEQGAIVAEQTGLSGEEPGPATIPVPDDVVLLEASSPVLVEAPVDLEHTTGPEREPHRELDAETIIDAPTPSTRASPRRACTRLPTILGPQSAMRTWSERAADLPDDDEAEAMGARPELVVLPRRKLRKPRRLTDIVLQRRTMVAGAVIVLGVAVAVYGLSAGVAPGGNGHPRHSMGKKMGKLVGGMFVGAGRVLDGFRKALE